MTAEIIDGGECRVVVKMPQMRAIRPVQADAGLKAKVKNYRSCRDAPHVVYGRRTLWWTPGPRTPLFRLLVSYRTLASIWLIAKKPRAPGHARRELVQRDLSSLSQGIAQNNKARNR